MPPRRSPRKLPGSRESSHAPSRNVARSQSAARRTTRLGSVGAARRAPRPGSESRATSRATATFRPSTYLRPATIGAPASYVSPYPRLTPVIEHGPGSPDSSEFMEEPSRMDFEREADYNGMIAESVEVSGRDRNRTRGYESNTEDDAGPVYVT